MRTAKSILERDVKTIPDGDKVSVVDALRAVNDNIIALIRLVINIRSNQALTIPDDKKMTKKETK